MTIETTNPASFATLLRRHRIAAGLSQEALAERAGLSARAISDLERGLRRAPYCDTIRLLADALGLTPEERTDLAASVSRRRGTAGVTGGRSDAGRGDVPQPATSFVGRERERAIVLRLLESARLLTLTGPGAWARRGWRRTSPSA